MKTGNHDDVAKAAPESGLEQAISYRRFEGGDAETHQLVIGLSDRILAHRPAGLIEDRLPFAPRPDLFLAERNGQPIGFKLGYQTSGALYFSWLGGVDADHRRLGIASQLMELQHDHLRSIGVRAVETRTRSTNQPMLIVNLRAGFDIVGVESDGYGRFVVLQRKELRREGGDN